jgi:hypothetical protein
MKIRWKYKEDSRWTRWVDIDKTKKFLPEEAFEFQIAETLLLKDAMMFFPGMFKSLREDFKKHEKNLLKAKKNLAKARGVDTDTQA